jgi:hypothetical protein
MEWVRWIKAGGVSFGGGSDVFKTGLETVNGNGVGGSPGIVFL